MNIKQLSKRQFGALFFVVVVATTIVATGFGAVSVHAVGGACSSDDAKITDPCMDENRNGTDLSPGEFSKLVQECKRPSNTTQTLRGCSNAIATCYRYVSDTRACKDSDVIRRGAHEGNNDGDVGPSDWDEIIAAHNQDYESKYSTNDEQYRRFESSVNTGAEAACKNKPTIAEYTTCVNNINAAYKECAGNDTHRNLVLEDVQKCMRGKARDGTLCAVSNGTWNTTTRKCDKKIPKDSDGDGIPDEEEEEGQDKGGQSGGYGADTQKCGKARTNLIACENVGGTQCNDDGSNAVQCIGNVLKIILGILTAIVGIVAVGGIA